MSWRLKCIIVPSEPLPDRSVRPKRSGSMRKPNEREKRRNAMATTTPRIAMIGHTNPCRNLSLATKARTNDDSAVYPGSVTAIGTGT